MAQQTTLDEWAKDPVVDPEVRAHVYSLVNAVRSPQNPRQFTALLMASSSVVLEKTEHTSSATTHC